ncbi:hypothetical protein JTE90_010989 [Oedothorax gibbosus]|uniref:Uncharacterized protein n=1 Tax=Oedothorax gibbosus TaxID=931172 RepID=A0AAV6VEP6_9ARAC|nr:hypothetical protein JTE90_010989 [Oedothorax gibbosus]
MSTHRQCQLDVTRIIGRVYVYVPLRPIHRTTIEKRSSRQQTLTLLRHSGKRKSVGGWFDIPPVAAQSS